MESNILAYESTAKKNVVQEAPKKRQELDTANQAAAQADAKGKLAEAQKNKVKAAVEAQQLAQAEAKQKAALATLSTKNAEKATRAAQKKSVVDMTPPTEANPLKQKAVTLPEAHEDEDRHSQHKFPDPRDAELWDHLGIT